MTYASLHAARVACDGRRAYGRSVDQLVQPGPMLAVAAHAGAVYAATYAVSGISLLLGCAVWSSVSVMLTLVLCAIDFRRSPDLAAIVGIAVTVAGAAVLFSPGGPEWDR